MVPSFNSYNILKESISLSKLANGHSRVSKYSEMISGFKSKGYEFLGNISLKVKSINVFAYDEILNVVPDELCDKLRECGHMDRDYISHRPDKRNLNTNTFGDFNLDRLLEVLSEPNIEKVSSCFSKKGDLYYVLWNEDEKYFYFITIDPQSYGSGAIGFLELFIKIRNSGIDVVNGEVDELYSKYLDEKSAREEEERKRQEEREAKRVKEEAYKVRVDNIKADVEANPDNYEEIKEKDLPEDIKTALDSDDYMDSPYVVYKQFVKSEPYDVNVYMCYVNDDDLTKGYKFEKRIDSSRRGTYYGD